MREPSEPGVIFRTQTLDTESAGKWITVRCPDWNLPKTLEVHGFQEIGGELYHRRDVVLPNGTGHVTFKRGPWRL